MNTINRAGKVLHNPTPLNRVMYLMDNSQGRKPLKKLLNVLRKSSTSLIIRDMGIKITLASNLSLNRLLKIRRFANSFSKTVGERCTLLHTAYGYAKSANPFEDNLTMSAKIINRIFLD